MKPILKPAAYILVVGILIFISCKKEYSCEGCVNGNKPPIAIAGPDQLITLPTDSVSLDGSSSSDPDGTVSGYLWKKISGPASFTINNASALRTVVKNLTAGIYRFELIVTDNGSLSAKDTMQVIVDSVVTTNHPPVANAGADQTITLPTITVALDGSGSTDPDNNITNYTWAKISGPSTFNISIANIVQTQVTNLVQGVYQFELKVTDAGGLFSKDTMQVIVNTTQTDPCAANRALVSAQLTPFGTLSEQKSEVTIGTAGNKIVFAGGLVDEALSTVDIYDIVTHAWSTAHLSVPRINMGVATCGNKIFFAGGLYTNGVISNLCKYVDIYDASTNTWSVDSLSSARSALAGASVGNKVFFAGGTTPNYSIDYSNTVDIYDITTNTWSTTTLSEARGSLTAVTVDNKIYFAGGDKGYYSYSNRIDIYDNATGLWSTSMLSEPKSSMASIAYNGKIYWAGGINSVTPPASSQVEIRDVTAQTSSIACLFQPNTWSTLPNTAAEKNNKLIFFNGGGTVVNNKFDIYDVASNTWSIGVLPQEIHRASVISVNNTIYVAGGYLNGVVGGHLSNQVWKLEF